jgi:hypothetical protein
LILEGLVGNGLLRWVVDVVLVLTALSLGLAVFAIRLRFVTDAREARRRELEDIWMPRVLRVTTGDADPAALAASVAPGDARAFLDFLYRFARRLRGPELQAVRTLAVPHLKTLVRELDRAEAERRARIVQIVGEFGLPEHLPVVKEALDDPSPLVAMVAARRIFRPGNEDHFEAVLSRLKRFFPWSPRLLAGMLHAGGAGAVPLVRALYADPKRAELERTVAAEALRMFPDPGAAELAEGVLASERDRRELVAATLRLLREVGRGEHRSLVVSFLDHDSSVVRQAAVETLGAVGGAGDADRIADRMWDDSPWVSLAAARALKSLGEQARLARSAADERRGGLAARQILERDE